MIGLSAAAAGTVLNGAFSFFQKIRESRCRNLAAKGKYPGKCAAYNRDERIRQQQQLQGIQSDRIGGIVQSPARYTGVKPVQFSVKYGQGGGLLSFFQQNKTLVTAAGIGLAGFFLLPRILGTPKKKSRRVTRRRKASTTKSTSARSATRRAKPAGNTRGGLPVMPKKYASGCKGKKGKELSTCLQWWKKYRNGKAKR